MTSNYVVISDDAVYRLFYEVTFDVFCRLDKDEQSKDADVILGARLMTAKVIRYLEEAKEYEQAQNPSAD